MLLLYFSLTWIVIIIFFRFQGGGLAYPICLFFYDWFWRFQGGPKVNSSRYSNVSVSPLSRNSSISAKSTGIFMKLETEASGVPTGWSHISWSSPLFYQHPLEPLYSPLYPYNLAKWAWIFMNFKQKLLGSQLVDPTGPGNPFCSISHFWSPLEPSGSPWNPLEPSISL